MPENTAVPSAWRSSAPAPIAHTSGDDAEDEGERGHQDRPQPQPRRLDRRLDAVAALVLELLGELDDQDRVLGRQPDQHDEADLREDVVVLPAQDDADDRREQAHRHDQDDRQRQRQALDTAPPAPGTRTPPPSAKAKIAVLPARDLLEGERRPLVARSLAAASRRRASP